MRFALPAILALPVLAVACAPEPPPRPAPPAPIAAPPAPAPAPINAAPVGLDGRWRGHVRRMPNQDAACRPMRLPAVMTVNGGRAALRIGQTAPTEATITSDGMATFADGTMSAEGRFTTQGFSGEYRRMGCTYSMSLRKAGR
ncbi:hypothetical protein [Rhodovarius crocodyli]|uniref:hypothetical protein n=1 Tax=Rhodovarius crocodyli TaxID=1979269 RepID=UPI00197F585E|nr:hypothetical protein [Rhodovarius crocodyli]